MSLDTRVSNLIKNIYAAGVDRSAWDAATVELFQLIGCRGGLAALIGLNRLQLLSCRVYAPARTDCDSAVDEYAGLYQHDPMFERAIGQGDGRFFGSSNLEQLWAPFVDWTAKTFGSAYWYGGFAPAGRNIVFYLLGHYSAEPSDEAVKLFQIVFDHFECAMRVGRRPFNLESSRALLRLDSGGLVEQVSKGAERLLGGRSPLKVSNGRLVATGRTEQKNLDRAFQRVLGEGGTEAVATAVQIARKTEGRPWIIVMRPVIEYHGPFGALRRNVDVEVLDQLPVIRRLDVVQSLFELTGRELQVLSLLAQGHSIDSLSAQIEVSRNTTRAHLRSIFSKTQTNSQAELMQLCGGLSSLGAA